MPFLVYVSFFAFWETTDFNRSAHGVDISCSSLRIVFIVHRCRLFVRF